MSVTEKPAIPKGLCQCGCGGHTKTIRYTRVALGLVKGEPYRFVLGHRLTRKTDWRTSIEQPSDPTIRHIPLTQGRAVIVDAADYEWLVQWKWTARPNASAGSVYAQRGTGCDGKQFIILMHRAILGLEKGDSREGDHVNGNTLDNRRVNLRIATHGQNSYNVSRNCVNTSGYKGVHYCRDATRSAPWVAVIHADRKRVYLGHFRTPDAAYAAYCEAAKRLHGEFARTA